MPLVLVIKSLPFTKPEMFFFLFLWLALAKNMQYSYLIP
jgi:hypothetical protein